jgi:hypothetical protein
MEKLAKVVEVDIDGRPVNSEFFLIDEEDCIEQKILSSSWIKFKNREKCEKYNKKYNKHLDLSYSEIFFLTEDEIKGIIKVLTIDFEKAKHKLDSFMELYQKLKH